MNSKLENVLNLALETPEQERMQTEDLNVGFDEASRTWEVIVKYNGNLDRLTTQGIVVEYLIAGYAILTIPEELVEAVAELEEIEYVEKPKRFFYEQTQPTADRCFPPVTMRTPFLSGEGVLLAVLDSGIDWSRADFRKSDGSTRIRFLWDQTIMGDNPPEGFAMGTEYGETQINQALQAETEQERFRILPSRDVSGHGTAVTGIAAGASEQDNYLGVAYNAQLLIVKLGLPGELGFPRTTEVMRGVTYAVRKAVELQMPLVINLSFGNNYGSHDGTSLLERFLDNAAEIGRTVICVGSGNEGNADGHVAGTVQERQIVELSVGEYERTLSIQLWKNYSDEFRIFLQTPGGAEVALPPEVESGKYTIDVERTRVLVYMGEPRPYTTSQEIYLELIPLQGNYINGGVWTIRLEPVRVVDGYYYLYLPGQSVRNAASRFRRPSPQATLTIPSTAQKVITVGAFNFLFDAYADFSGRGYGNRIGELGIVSSGFVKPDLVASGVDVAAPNIYGGYSGYTGTSFATPIVSGSAALLMEWGIVKQNDIFLYGEKVKAYLRKGARPIRGEDTYPNERVGWGALCVSASLP